MLVRSGHSGNVRLVQVRLVRWVVRLGRSGQVGKFRSGQFRQDRSLQVWSGQVISVQVRVVKSGQVSLDRTSHVGPVMSRQFWSDQVKQVSLV